MTTKAALGHDHFAFWQGRLTQLTDTSNFLRLKAAALELEAGILPLRLSTAQMLIASAVLKQAEAIEDEIYAVKTYARVIAELAEEVPKVLKEKEK